MTVLCLLNVYLKLPFFGDIFCNFVILFNQYLSQVIVKFTKDLFLLYILIIETLYYVNNMNKIFCIEIVHLSVFILIPYLFSTVINILVAF